MTEAHFWVKQPKPVGTISLFLKSKDEVSRSCNLQEQQQQQRYSNKGDIDFSLLLLRHLKSIFKKPIYFEMLMV
ncbi:hypothetical protein FRX31_019573 [Thalictrum thalictroides]|uniref:Uncharacterized protein n=1 Tax=Thalictrum thalictroides TaxID=46969 RepID=A0A7J6W0Z4_THATH|nr:hypothetical protein FRX31_019573 [Thalictrum thalictroides]